MDVISAQWPPAMENVGFSDLLVLVMEFLPQGLHKRQLEVWDAQMKVTAVQVPYSVQVCYGTGP